jgi:hypothetical protein
MPTPISTERRKLQFSELNELASWVEDSPSSPDSPMVGQEGKQVLGGVTGGGFMSGLSGGPRHGIVVLSLLDLGTEEGYCGGLIGKARRMCVRTNCDVAAHRTSKTTIFTKENAEELIFIKAHAGSGDDFPTSVFLDPVIAPYLLEEDLEEAKGRLKSVEGWQSTFDSLKGSAQSGAPRQDTQLFKRAAKEVTFGVTPRKQSRIAVELAVSPPGFEILYHPLAPELEGSQEVVLSTLKTSWPLLLSNIETVKDQTEKAKTDTRLIAAATEAEFDEMGVKIAHLKTLIGDRTTHNFDTQSIFQILEDLEDSIDGLEIKMKMSYVTTDQMEDRLAKMEDKLMTQFDTTLGDFLLRGQFNTNFVKPVISLVKKATHAGGAPGSKWEDQLVSLDTKVTKLERDFTKQGGPSLPRQTFPNVFGNIGGAGGLPTAKAPGGQNSDVTQDIKEINTRIEELQNEIDSDRIRLGSITFKSVPHVQTWMVTNGARRHFHLFLDAMSFLTVSDGVTGDVGEALSFRAQSAKAQDTCTEQSKYIGSFSLEVPPIFGKGRDPNTTPNQRSLGAVPAYEDWDTGCGHNGVRHRLEDMLSDGYSNQALAIRTNLTGEAANVALEMLTMSKAFWSDFIFWINKFYTELLNRSRGSKKECWVLVSYCVRTVFSLIRKSRLIGTNASEHGMFWASLQAHRTMKELLEHGFEGHPKVAVVLHQHLIDYSTPLSAFELLETKMVELQKEVKAVKSQTDKNAAAKAKGPKVP